MNIYGVATIEVLSFSPHVHPMRGVISKPTVQILSSKWLSNVVNVTVEMTRTGLTDLKTCMPNTITHPVNLSFLSPSSNSLSPPLFPVYKSGKLV